MYDMSANVITGTVEGKGFLMDYFSFGDGTQPFVLLPGVSLLPITPLAELVAKQYRRFHDGYKTYLFDRKHDVVDGYSVEDMADDTAEAMRLLGIKGAYVMGTSQGGMIGQILAAKYPELVAKLVLCCTISSANEVTVNTLSKWVNIAKTGDVYALNMAFFRNIYSDAFLAKNADTLEKVAIVGEADDVRRFIALANACLGFDARPLLGEIKCDCLVVGSEIDKVVGAEPSRRLAERLGCDLIMYGQYGHAAFDEAPDLHDHILDFFGKNK